MMTKRPRTETEIDARAVWALKKQLLALLADSPTPVQEVALADAVALMIANKQSVNENAMPTEAVQHAAMDRHIEQVMRLIPVNTDILQRAKKMKAN